MTHVGSGWEKLAEALERTPRFHVFSTGRSYQYIDDILWLNDHPHRRQNSASIWVDVVLHNKDFNLKRLCPYYGFIFWWKPFEQCQAELLKSYGPQQAKDYWEYRTAGMLQYRRRCPRHLWNPSLDGESVLHSILG